MKIFKVRNLRIVGDILFFEESELDMLTRDLRGSEVGSKYTVEVIEMDELVFKSLSLET